MRKINIQFSSKEKEAAYRAHYLPADNNLARYIIVVIFVASIIFVSSDLKFTASNSDLMPLVIIRSCFVVWSLLILYLLKTIKNSHAFDLLTGAWLLGLIAMMVFIYATRPIGNLSNTLTSCLMVLLFYALFPARLSVQIFCALSLSFANILHVYEIKDQLQLNTVNAIRTSYLVCNVLGVFIAVRWHKSRRREFSTYLKACSLRKKLEELAYTDDLTGLANRRSSLKKMVSEYHRHERYGNNLSIMLIDIDFFKEVNDAYGHDLGDMVLKHIASLFKSCSRSHDHAGRFGGEEFLILLPETSLSEAIQLAERLRKHCAESAVTTNDNEIKITVSVGVVQANTRDANAKDMLKRADVALYQAKERGRNCVVEG